MPRKRPPRHCRRCQKKLKQNYYQYCSDCRKIIKREKKLNREIRRVIKETLSY